MIISYPFFVMVSTSLVVSAIYLDRSFAGSPIPCFRFCSCLCSSIKKLVRLYFTEVVHRTSFSSTSTSMVLIMARRRCRLFCRKYAFEVRYRNVRLKGSVGHQSMINAPKASFLSARTAPGQVPRTCPPEPPGFFSKFRHKPEPNLTWCLQMGSSDLDLT